MKKITLICLFFLAILTAIVRFDARQSELNTLEVGVLLPLSSDFAWWGETIQHSIETAQSNGFGREFKFIYGDTKCNSKDAVSTTQSLKALHPSMHLFIVGCDNDMQAIEPLLNKDTDLAFMVGLSGKNLYKSHFPIVNLAYLLETEAIVAAQFVHDKLGVKTLGIITDNGTFGSTLASSSTGYFDDIGGKTVSEQLKYNEPNPETSILKIIQTKPDAIYMQNDIPGLVAILKRLDQLGYKGSRILYYGGHDQSLIDTAGRAAEGAYVPWAISDENNTKRTRFLDVFKKTYKKDPFITAYFIYDGINLLDEAGKACKKQIRCIEKYFYDKSDFEGVLGKVRYQPDGEVDRNFYFQQIRGGKFAEVK